MANTLQLDYAGLLAQVQDFVDDDNAEFVAAIPTLILLAESKVATDLNMERFDTTATGNLTGAQEFQDILPADEQAVREVYLTVSGERRALVRRPWAWLVEFTPDATVEGVPRYWAYEDEQATVATRINLAPTPDSAYAYTIRYTGPPESLTNTNTTTWISQNAGDLLLYRTLNEAEHWLKSDQAQRWMDKYVDTLASRRLELRNAIRSGDYLPVKASPQKV